MMLFITRVGEAFWLYFYSVLEGLYENFDYKFEKFDYNMSLQQFPRS